MRRLLLLLPALFCAEVVIAENPARRAQEEKDALAHVGGELIRVDDYLREIERLRHKAPSLIVDQDARRQVFDDMVRHKTLLMRAIEAGYGDHPNVVEVWEQMMIKTYLRESLEPRLEALEVEEAEVEAWYAEHAERYAIPARSRAAIVFYEITEHTQPEKRQAIRSKAEAALAEAASLEPSIRHFGEIARRDSEHRASRYQGGVVGWLTHLPKTTSALPSEVVEAVFALETPGQIAPLVETDEGIYLVRLVDRESSRMQALDQVSAGIRHQLMREKRSALRRSFEVEARAQLGVEVDEEFFAIVDDAVERPTPPAGPLVGQEG